MTGVLVLGRVRIQIRIMIRIRVRVRDRVVVTFNVSVGAIVAGCAMSASTHLIFTSSNLTSSDLTRSHLILPIHSYNRGIS